MMYRVRSTSEAQSASKSMNTSMKGLRADISQLDYDARVQGWRQEGWGGPEEYVQARVTESSHEVMLLAPYAEASVSVTSEASKVEQRRCSLCLN
jgi:hypothetical protein